MNLWNYLKSKMQKNIYQEICEGDATMTYEDMIVFAEEFAKNLVGLKCCAIMCKSEMAASMILLSCFAAGVTAIPLSDRYGKLHSKKILDTISPEAVITDMDGKFHILRITDAEYKEPEIHPALIMCTSGTTGVPKGAMLTETNVLSNVIDIASYFNIDSNDTILIARPLYHCAVLTGEFLTGLIKGVKIRFYSGNFNPTLILKFLKEYRITAFCGTPTLLYMMARFKRSEDEYFLNHICISGECMSFETGKYIADAFANTDIYHIYGLTEACPRVSYLPPALFTEYCDCVGIPLQSVSLKVLLDDGSVAKGNEIGMLWVKGDNVMAGYYNNPEKTAEVLKDGWLCTGDLALINSKGLLKIKGRKDDLIIKAGMNIYPQEIEGSLKTDSRVKELYVYGYKDEKLGTQIVLNIVGDFSDVSEVKELCRMNLPTYQMPTKINLLDELSKNGSGKIIRRR